MLSGGGAERVIANLSNQFSNDNFEVVLVTTYVTRNEYEVVNTVKRINIEDSINLNSNRILKNYKIMRSLRHILTDEKPDVTVSFIANNPWMLYCEAPFDPELTPSTSTYGQGNDYFMQPSVRSFGFGIKFKL